MRGEPLQNLLDRLDLGRMIGEPEKVTGGLLHRMWRATTASGSYAIKQLSSDIMSRPGISKVYILSEKIASAYESHGLPAVPAIVHNGTPLHRFGRDMVMIYKWYDGRPVAVGSIDGKRNFKMGSLLASLHEYQPEIEGLDGPAFASFEEKYWLDLLDEARGKNAPWMFHSDEVVSEIIALSNQYSRASKALRQELVVSHRDMDQKNILWTNDDEPLIIDWEAAGMTNPAMELFDTALNWSGRAETDEGVEAFSSFIHGYRNIRSAPETDGKTAFLGIIGNWLAWIEYNMRRSIGDHFDREEKLIGAKEVSSTLKTLISLFSCRDELTNLYEESLSGV